MGDDPSAPIEPPARGAARPEKGAELHWVVTDTRAAPHEDPIAGGFARGVGEEGERPVDLPIELRGHQADRPPPTFVAFVFFEPSKRRMYKINQAKRQLKRLPFYRELVRLCAKSLSAAKRAVPRLRRMEGPRAKKLADGLQYLTEVTPKVLSQTRRRLFAGESVPAAEKVVSIFEEHTDVIRKGGRDTEYGHKICIAAGSSTLILDCSIEDGAPSDSALALDSVKRVRSAMGKLPHAVAFDGGFSSMENLVALKGLGVAEVMFHRKGNLVDTALMTSSPEIHKALWRFRAGVEGCVSFLKRCFGLRRANWKGRSGFDRFVHASILTANLLTMARLRLRSA